MPRSPRGGRTDVSDEDSTQDRLRVGGWVPPYDRQAHDGPALPPTTALSGEVLEPLPLSAPPATLWPRRAPRGQTLRIAVLAAVGALALYTLLTLLPISRNSTPPTRAAEGPRVTALPGPPSPSPAVSSAAPSSSTQPAEPVNLTTNPTTPAPTGPTPTPGGTTAVPSPTGTPVMSGTRLSLEPLTYPGYRVRHENFAGRIDPINMYSSPVDRADATFTVRVGLADSRCVSFEATNYPGYYLRHQDFRIYLHRADGTQLFRADATFCAINGLAGQYTSLRSYNYPGHYLRHRSDRQLYLDQYDGSGQTAAAMTYAVRAGL